MEITSLTWLIFTYAQPAISGKLALVPIALIGILAAVDSLATAVIDPFLSH